MPGAVRVGVDQCSGHDGFNPRICDSGSPNVFVNNKAVVRVGDHWITHTDNNNNHDSTSATGSPNVFANGKAKCRIGDSVECGSTMANGSSNVLVN